MPKIKMRKVPGYDNGGFIKDTTGLGTFLYNQPVEMQLKGTNPIVGGPMDVFATDETGKKAYIKAGQKNPIFMKGKVKEVPIFKEGGKFTPGGAPNRMRNHSVGNYNPHVDFYRSNLKNLSPISDPAITDSVKPVDEEDANIEAEKGELIMKPQMMGIYNIKGKSHKQGGTPLFAEGGSFIFSNDKKLAVDKEEKEMFGFDKTKSNAAKDNTPASILANEVKPKEYNKFLSILKDDKASYIAKSTAMLMLEKMQDKIGKVAFVQESKKGKTIPDFAMGTAPIKRDEFDDAEQEQKMYQRGGTYDYNGGSGSGAGATGTWGFDQNGDYGNFDDINLPPPNAPYVPWAAASNKDRGKDHMGWRPPLPIPVVNPPEAQPFNTKSTPFTYRPSVTPNLNANVGNIPGPGVNNIGADAPVPSLGYDIKGKLTPAQLTSLSQLGLQAMSVKKYNPMREQVSLPDINLNKINEQPYLNNINNQAYAAYKLAGLSRGNNASTIASSIYGKSLDQSSQTLGNINNQNNQIQNQQNQINLQQRTNQTMTNSQLNSRYYDQVNATNQNYDDERRFANNQVFSNLNNYQSQADALAWTLASVNKYGRRPIYDKNHNLVAYQPTPLYEYTGNGIRYNKDVADLNLATGSNKVNSLDEISKYSEALRAQGYDQKSAAYLLKAIIGAKQPYYNRDPNSP